MLLIVLEEKNIFKEKNHQNKKKETRSLKSFILKARAFFPLLACFWFFFSPELFCCCGLLCLHFCYLCCFCFFFFFVGEGAGKSVCDVTKESLWKGQRGSDERLLLKPALAPPGPNLVCSYQLAVPPGVQWKVIAVIVGASWIWPESNTFTGEEKRGKKIEEEERKALWAGIHWPFLPVGNPLRFLATCPALSDIIWLFI